MNNLYAIEMVGVIVGMTVLVRFLPFLIFNGTRKTPDYVIWLGQVLPYAIMGMLIVYCLKGVSFSASPYGVPELIACVIVALLHKWKRNSLLSIGVGTGCYMILIQINLQHFVEGMIP